MLVDRNRGEETNTVRCGLSGSQMRDDTDAHRELSKNVVNSITKMVSKSHGHRG